MITISRIITIIMFRHGNQFVALIHQHDSHYCVRVCLVAVM
jgi:hypothetical protein